MDKTYYRNYRRPYYYAKHSHSSSSGFSKFLSVIAVLSIFGFIVNGRDLQMSPPFIIALCLCIGWLIYRFWKKHASRTSVLQEGNSQNEIALINSEKHGCKCYMEHLTSGEQEIAHILSKELNYKDYFIFNNLTIPSSYNGSSQIDHLVVSRFGIFVIESKDYHGWIFGNADQERWTQSLPGGRSKFQFENPIRQNWSHIKALQSLISFVLEENFRSIVVFSDKCEIKTPPIENVVRQEALIGVIKKFTEKKLSEEQLQLIIGKLSYVCQTADISPSQHIADINSHHLSVNGVSHH